MAAITKENARELAAKSLAKRKENLAILRKAALAPAFIPAPQPVQVLVNPVQTPAPATYDCPGLNIAQVRDRLTALDCMMANAKTDREWDNLSRAYERMFKIWCVLTRTPGPGNLRPEAEKPARRQAPIRPDIELAPGPEPTPESAP